jgi:sucrose-6-phosphate hydrolase SacC (GH32 family)
VVSPGLAAAEATKEPLEPWSEPAALRAISGTWTFGKGTIAGATDAGDVFGRLEDRAADFELEADVTLADGRGAAALVFRATPGLDGLYAVTLDHGASVVRLFKWPDATILRDVPFVFRPGTTYHVRVAATGPHITAAVDGKQLIEVADTSHTEGYLGLNVFGCGKPAQATFTAVRFRRTDSAEARIRRVEALIDSAAQLQEQLRGDPHRPAYHFLPPQAWMNDINGALFWKGRYHIFYQHNPEGGYWKWMQWGHASSVDLVHWVHHPIALTPTPGGPDRDGCFSGGAVVHNGVPTVIYHGVPEGTCLATSQDDLLIRWTKHPANPVITPKKVAGDFRVYDPCAWQMGDSWYALCGGLDPAGGDTAFLFKSPDLCRWEYLHPFYQSDRRWTEVDEDCAVPDFFPLGNKHMLLFCSHLQGTQYYLGRLDGERFQPETHGRMSWPGGLLGGAITLLDARQRRIYFDWIRELRGHPWERESGWSGVMTLPRILSLGEDGTLRIEPAPELEVLRYHRRQHQNVQLGASSERVLEDVQGECLELALEIEPGAAGRCGVRLRCSPDGAEQTVVACEPAAKKLVIEMGKSSLDPRIRYLPYRHAGALNRLPEDQRLVTAQEAPFTLQPGETLRLRIFVDRSVVEVFANGRQCLTQRIYPTRRDSLGVVLFSTGSAARFKSVEAWNLGPAQSP